MSSAHRETRDTYRQTLYARASSITHERTRVRPQRAYTSTNDIRQHTSLHRRKHTYFISLRASERSRAHVSRRVHTERCARRVVFLEPTAASQGGGRGILHPARRFARTSRASFPRNEMRMRLQHVLITLFGPHNNARKTPTILRANNYST